MKFIYIFKLFLILTLVPLKTFAVDFRFNFEGTPLFSVVENISNLTGYSIVYDPTIGEIPISLVISKDQPFKRIIPLFDSSLNSVGLTIVQRNGVYSIESNPLSKQLDTKIFTLPNSTDSDKVLDGIKESFPKDKDSKIEFTASLIDSTHLIVTADIFTLKKVGLIINALEKKRVPRVYSLDSEVTKEEIDHIKKSFPDSIITYSNYRLAVTATTADQLRIFSFLKTFTKKTEVYQVNFVISSISENSSKDRGLNLILNSGSFSLSNTLLNFDSTLSLDRFSFFLNWLDSNSLSEIISKPHLQLQPNGVDSRFTLGKEISVRTSTIDQSTGQSIQNYETKKIGLEINASLRHSFSKELLLDLSQSLTSLTGYDEALNPMFDSQSINTTLNVKPNVVYVVGGIEDQRSQKGEKFSFIPFNKNESKENSQLYIFVYLTPIEELEINDLPKNNLYEKPKKDRKSIKNDENLYEYDLLNMEY